MPNGRKKSLIDQMFEYAIDGDIELTDDLIDVLAAEVIPADGLFGTLSKLSAGAIK